SDQHHISIRVHYCGVTGSKLLSAIDVCDEKYDYKMQNHRNVYRTDNQVPGLKIMFDRQVALTLENSIKRREASVSVSRNDDARCNAMRECHPGRAKDRIDR